MIHRDISNSLLKLMKQFPAVGVIGPRQSGKTTLAKQFIKHWKTSCVYIDLESMSDMRKLSDPELFFKSEEGKCIIIDEIQRMPELFPLLRHLIDNKRKPGRFLLLGSASPHLVRDASESLAGRIFYLDAHPFNLTELEIKRNTVNRHWLRGGFPDALLAGSDAKSQLWMQGFIRTYVERDFNHLFGVNFSPQLLFKIWRMLGYHHSQIWNAQSFSKGLDVSPHTVNRYLDYLEGAFIIRKLPPYFTNTKKRLVKTPKVYIRDSGMVHYLNDIHSLDKLRHHPMLGFTWEGYVVEQILQLLPHSMHAFYYRTHDGSEMDLVIMKGIKPALCIEIKYSTAPVATKGMMNSITDLKCKHNYIITPSDEGVYPLNKNVNVCGLYPFLTKVLPTFI